MLAALSHSPIVRVLGFTLVHFLWQGVVIAFVLAVVLSLLARTSAAARYGAACTALGLMALAPVATFWFLFTYLPAPLPVSAFPDAGSLASSGSPSSAMPVTALIAAGWLVGALVMTARLAGGLLYLRRIVRRHCVALPPAWQSRVEQIAERLGIRRPVHLAGSARVGVPMVVGWLRPVIVVPLVVLTSLSESDLEAILAHELAHVRRFDSLVHMLQSVVEAALFYHPCVWWVSRSIRVEREYACDDAVVSLGNDPLRYARALSELETLRAHMPELALGSTGGALMSRIQRLVEKESPMASSPRAWLLPVLLLGAALGLTAGGIAACAREPDPPATANPAASEQVSVEIPWLPPALDPWKPTLVATAARYGIDPAALAIVTLVESGGNPEAKSPTGAVGLMQLMPATAARIARERGLSDHSDERLYDPAYNIDLGAFYLAKQLSSFEAQGDPDRSIELAAAAYNGGPGRVRKYLDGTEALSEETEHYKALVAGLWNERHLPHSATYDAWRERVRGRAAEQANSPLPGAKVTLPFGNQPQPFTGKEYFHEGIDLAEEAGSAVIAPLQGTVKSAAAQGDRGNVVVLEHAGGIETRFHHLGDISVQPGQKIGRGDAIGTVGMTGKTTGPHVHFEVRDNGEPLDPAPYLGQAR